MNQTTNAPRLRLERTFDATPQEVWAAWADPQQYAKWLNPSGIDLVIHAWDFREGGTVRFDMPQPDGNPNPQSGVFHEIRPHKRLVSGAPDRSFLLEVDFIPDGKRTRLVVTATGVPPEFHDAATQGWNICFDQLASVIGRTQGDLVIVRTFDAAPKDIWNAWTDAKRFQEWYGPASFTVPQARFDPKVGGTYTYCMRGPDGKDRWGTGTYKELVPHSRLVLEESPADKNGNPAGPSNRFIVTLEDLKGRTRLTLRHKGLPAGPGGDMAAKGWNGAFDKLAKRLPKEA